MREEVGEKETERDAVGETKNGEVVVAQVERNRARRGR